MATIVFIFYPETGHLNATLKFARTLHARGHSVRYFGLYDFEKRVRSQGMSFMPASHRPLGQPDFDSSTADQMLRHFATLLEGVAERPERGLLEIPLDGGRQPTPRPSGPRLNRPSGGASSISRLIKHGGIHDEREQQ